MNLSLSNHCPLLYGAGSLKSQRHWEAPPHNFLVSSLKGCNETTRNSMMVSVRCLHAEVGVERRYLIAYDRISRAKRARTDATSSMVTEVQSGFRYTQRSVSSASRSVDLGIGRILSQVSPSYYANLIVKPY